MRTKKLYVSWYARRITTLIYTLIEPLILWFFRIIAYLLIAFSMLAIMARIMMWQESKKPYNLHTELFDVRSARTGTYTSGDSITDMVVNYFAGRHDLPFSLKAQILYFHEKDVFASLVDNVSDNTAEIYKGLLEGYDTLSLDEYIHMKESSKDSIQKYFHWIPESVSRDALYYAVWKLYFESGAPRLEISPDPSATPSYYFGAAAYYEPMQKKLYMRMPFETFAYDLTWSLDDFFEELAHAKQFEERPWTSTVGSLAGIYRTVYRSVERDLYNRKRVSRQESYEVEAELYNRKPISWEESYDYEYTQQGSFEFEAHSVIGSILMRRCEEQMNFFLEDVAY